MAQGKTGSSSPPGGPPKPGSQLDSMLGSLQSDLNKLGVATVAKGVCGACKKPIAGQVMGARQGRGQQVGTGTFAPLGRSPMAGQGLEPHSASLFRS